MFVMFFFFFFFLNKVARLLVNQFKENTREEEDARM